MKCELHIICSENMLMISIILPPMIEMLLGVEK